MKYIIILLLLLPAVAAQESDEIFSSRGMTINLDISGGVVIDRIGSNYKVDFVQANLTMHPIESATQQVTSTSDPQATPAGDALQFRWNNPLPGEHDFTLNSEVKTQRNQPEVRTRIPFPNTFPDEVQQYTLSSKNIDAEHAEIVALAEELASGEDDLYKVVHKFAAWTQSNIEYNLSTITAHASLPASWVLESRQGVCDELTVLFIALNRAVGIPARFVSGMSYTDSELFTEEWGLHGWAEVYFPGVGWVPFDVTYGELGYTDASHIGLLNSEDPTQASTRYEWRSRDAKVETTELDIETKITDVGRKVQQQIFLSAEPVESRVNFGSFNLVELTIENLQDFYVSVDIIASNTEGLTLHQDERRIVLLSPGEVRTEYYVIEVSHNLNPSLIYTFPVAFLANGERIETKFQSSSRERSFSREEMESLIPDQDTRVFSSDVNLDCSAENYYTFESGQIVCSVSNTGNTPLTNLNVCHDSCSKINLGLGKSEEVTFELTNIDIGEKREQIQVSGPAQANTIVPFAVLDEPEVVILNTTTPEQVEFDQIFKLTYLIQRDSYSVPEDVIVTTKVNGLEKTWTREDLKGSQAYSLEMEGKVLKSGLNDIFIETSYQDRRGNTYESSATHQVELVNVNLIQHIEILMQSIDLWMRSLI